MKLSYTQPRLDRSILRWIPFRLIIVLVAITGIALTALLAVSFERERVLMEAIGAHDIKLQDLPDQTRFLLLVLAASATATATAVIVQHYKAVRRELDRIQVLSRNVLDSLTGGVITFDLSGRSTLMNQAGAKLIGISRSDVAKVGDLLSRRDELGRLVSQALSKESYVQDFDIPGHESAEIKVPLRISTFPLLEPSGRRTGVITLIKDITEVASLERELRTAEKLTSLGTLSAGIAHEIKNPLSAIDLNLRLLEAGVPQASHDQETREYFQILREEIGRLNSIVDNVLRFSRPSATPGGLVDVVDVLRRTVDLLAHNCRERSICIDLAVDSQGCTISGDASSLQQAFLNILLNAIQSMDQPGKIQVSLSVRGEASGSWCELAFQDPGCGINGKDIERIFDPFFTSKPGGTGLGLSIVHRIVADHNGTIHVDSTPGRGTRVVLRLPMATQEVLS
jgi:two-component system sensor histidine kinase AtoS